ncbi:MAG: UvrD-helicase domain-containing protein [Actinomycetota bacterium]|nr:UvrD-helicase domain-containing protein [Actinomycetota bacterium]
MSSTAQAPSFDVRGSLPEGITVLEASAGTGKTYAIAALAARYVADGIPLERILLVTFTRMATGELRERVRERLRDVEHRLGRALAGSPAAGDRIVELLADAPREIVAARRARLAASLANFDAATIATIHGFCQEVLGGLGIAADLAPETDFVEDVSDLISEVVDDLYVRKFHRDARPALDRAQALRIARIAIENPAAPIAPATGELPEMRRRLACSARVELEARKRRLGVMTYDDLLTRLDAALSGPQGPAIAARLRERYEVVLIDEFQDTDPVQWSIMRRAFGGNRTLVLIADPKQAIYSFRGADVYAYLEAAHEAQTRPTLTTNWRSDQALIDAYDALFGNARLGEEGIVYRRVRAADSNRAARLHGAPRGAPLRIRFVARESVALTRGGFAASKAAREYVAKDLAADLVDLLSSGAEVEIRPQGGTAPSSKPISPGHIAVLVATNRNAALVRGALADAGIPAVINGAGSVFGTETAFDWLRLLEALERPGSSSRAHGAALTPFLGWSPERIASADEGSWEQIHGRLHDWAGELRATGVAAMVEAIAAQENLAGRLLGAPDGERHMTDLRHIGQLLHRARSQDGLGITALTGWLRQRIVEADQDRGDEERSRRLESDADAVQVLTIHRSKGLEFPIVYAPFLWEPTFIPKNEPVTFHDGDAGKVRTLDLSLQGAAFRRHREQSIVELRGEDLRLAYVALTRARHQAVIWWIASWDSADSPLGRLLFAREDNGSIATSGGRPPGDDVALERLQAVAEQAPGCVSVERSSLGLPRRWSASLPEPGRLTTATFGRWLDRRWRRTSYSDITTGAHDMRVASEPEEPVISDEPPTEIVPSPGRSTVSDPVVAIPSPLAAMPVGVDVGTFVHRLLEATEFDAPDLDAELAVRFEAVRARTAVEVGDPAAALGGIRIAIETPLGPVLGHRRLRDFGRADRLDELVFELPLAGGDRPSGSVTPALIADVLRECVPADDPLSGYVHRLAEPALRQTVRGYLTGTLDLAVRTNGTDEPRYAVLDYKTDWLAPVGEPLTSWHYRPEALSAEMCRRHYALQALLYAVALHRYLRWRVPGYSCDRHLAGVAYLFLRGMTGPDTPALGAAPYGVFAWRPPTGLVQALSDALDQGAPA